jgi:carbonic anhydrase
MLEHPNRDQERRQESFSKQAPFAIIVGCSDSRVSPEVIFDEGIGDLFVVRVAGNVIGPLELDSIDYSALYLKSLVILVLGHENCGAVDAAVHNNTKDIEEVAHLIEPAVIEAKKNYPHNLLEMSIKINALRMKAFLLTTPIIKKLVNDKKIEVHAAYYHLKSGVVELLN